MSEIRPDVGLPNLARNVAVDILVHGAQSRASLADRMGISAATVTRIVRPLLDAGLLVESATVRTAERGRTALALDVLAERHRYIGVKLTTDTLYAVATDLRARVLDTVTVPIRPSRTSDVVETVARVVAELRAGGDVPLDAVGVTVGGHVAEGENVVDSPFLGWQDVPFRALLRERLDVPVYVDNDVVGLTTVQHWFGHGRGHQSFALLTVGAGIGYGLVVNDEIVPTEATPVSHLPVEPSGPLCPLGHRGCMSAYLVSDAIAAAVSVGHHRATSFAEALRLATSDDVVALRVVREASHALGRAANAVAVLTGVERIILSGEGVHLAEIAPDALHEGFREYDIHPTPRAELIVRPMDFLEWARGAASLAIQAEFPRVRGSAGATA
ncbi:ROK family transcriptional regulator [Georgenia halophila]|uniref:ROK family transcriptional regulator n=1 Tax=Georgenia halophila TaxID=620889 RepID=A0ABP8L9I5_9MICO